MPILPLDHPEPFAATLGVMLFPGEDDDSRKRARAYASQYLAEPLRRFHEAGETLTYEELAELHSDVGVPLGDLEARWRDGQATGELVKIFFALANTNPSLASWESAIKVVRNYVVKHEGSASRSLLHDALSRYRNVAHLWGAWCIRGRRMQSDLDVGYEGWDDFQSFLTESEILRGWGRTWRPERREARPPLSADAWSIPEDWAPPERQPDWPRTGGIPGMTVPQEMLRGLRRSGRPRKSS